MALEAACEVMIDPDALVEHCGCEFDWDTYQGPFTAEVLAEAASDVVALLTGGAVTGRCELIVRPCAGHRCGGCGVCHDCSVDAIPLPGDNVEVTEVLIGGVEVDESDYFLLDGYKLVRRSGLWPRWQDVRKLPTETGTFQITYLTGSLPTVAQLAALEVACDLFRSYVLDAPGKLPNRWATATADGVTVNSRAPFEESDLKRDDFPMVAKLMEIYGGPTDAVVRSPETLGGWKLFFV